MTAAFEMMQHAVSIGFDAMRLALGGEPLKHTPEEIILWLQIMTKFRQGGSK